MVQVQAEATEKLKEISVKYGYVGGKWYELVQNGVLRN